MEKTNRLNPNPRTVSIDERELEQLREGIGVKMFVKDILHGDDEHRAWLLEAADKWVKCEPIPPPRGKGAGGSR